MRAYHVHSHSERLRKPLLVMSPSSFSRLSRTQVALQHAGKVPNEKAYTGTYVWGSITFVVFVLHGIGLIVRAWRRALVPDYLRAW